MYIKWKITRPEAGDFHSLLYGYFYDGIDETTHCELFHEKSFFDISLKLAKRKIIRRIKLLLTEKV